MNEVETTHQKIQAAHRRNVAEIEGRVHREQKTQHVVTSDMEQIKMILQALMDKLVGLDLYVRSHQIGRQHERNPSTNFSEDRAVIGQTSPVDRDVTEQRHLPENRNGTTFEGTSETMPTL